MACNDCASQKVCSNTHKCTCPWVDCKNHGHCCDCIANHRAHGETPNCYPKTKA